MLVRVSSLANAHGLAKGWADAVISLVDPGQDPLPSFDAHAVFYLTMEDTEVITDPWSPKADDVAAVFGWLLPQDNVLVHCVAGISRSVAFGIGLWVSAGKTVEEAVSLVHADCPMMHPNKLILRHIDDHLKMGGKFIRQVNEAVYALTQEDLMLWCQDCGEYFIDGQNCPGKHFS